MPGCAAKPTALLRPLAGLLLVGLMLGARPAGADDAPLHERIDALVESACLAPLAAPAADDEFLRRAYLDLSGTLPDAATARAFLDDKDPNKRTALVDRLLAAPRFARHMAQEFDVMLMERRAQKSLPGAEWTISAAEWQEYLRKSVANDKPLDQLMREILAADGGEGELRAAAKFYFDREGDPDLLARDIGRLFFGRDFQCAQCHDHPLVDDYFQADYYGLKAFVIRGTFFDDAKLKKTYYAENADGEVNYKSVFTGEARDRVLPKLPQGAPLAEPVLAKEEAYVVAPAKDVRQIPKYSRRAQLAATATDGTSAGFNRNLANRLWAMMLGRGLVHPLDMQHSANPAVESQLLALLGDELVKMKFNLKTFLREVALSRVYQRASELPTSEQLPSDLAAATTKVAGWKAEAERIAGELPALQATTTAATAEVNGTYEKYVAANTARDAADKVRVEAKKASDEVSVALAAAVKDAATKDDVLKALVEARVKADAAAAKLPDDKPLAEAAATFTKRANEVDTQLAEVKKVVAEKTPQVQAASLKLAEADKGLETATAAVVVARAPFDAAETRSREAQQALRTAKSTHNELTARVTDAQAVLDYAGLAAAATASQTALAQIASQQQAAAGVTPELAAQTEQVRTAATEKAATDRAAADKAWNTLADRGTARFTLAPLKNLSPEQLAWATMQATGVADQQRTALAEQVTKDVAAMANVAPEARPAAEARLLEERADEKLRGNIGAFVSLFGQQPGQAPSFQATVHQALFLANGGLLAGWLNPGGNNLTERLAKIEQPEPLAEELYLSVLTRRPTPEEQAQVAAYWQAASADRAAAAREMVWALIVSAEFRFNH